MRLDASTLVGGNVIEDILEGWYRAHLEISKRESFEKAEEAKDNEDKSFNRKAWLEARIKQPRWLIFVPEYGICPARFRLN